MYRLLDFKTVNTHVLYQTDTPSENLLFPKGIFSLNMDNIYFSMCKYFDSFLLFRQRHLYQIPLLAISIKKIIYIRYKWEPTDWATLNYLPSCQWKSFYLSCDKVYCCLIIYKFNLPNKFNLIQHIFIQHVQIQLIFLLFPTEKEPFKNNCLFSKKIYPRNLVGN